MKEALVRGGAWRKRGAALVAAGALGAALLGAPPVAEEAAAEPHNSPGTCSYISSGWSYKDKNAQTIKLWVRVGNHGDKSTSCRVDVALGPDSPCKTIRAGGEYTYVMYRASFSYYRSLYHC